MSLSPFSLWWKSPDAALSATRKHKLLSCFLINAAFGPIRAREKLGLASLGGARSALARLRRSGSGVGRSVNRVTDAPMTHGNMRQNGVSRPPRTSRSILESPAPDRPAPR